MSRDFLSGISRRSFIKAAGAAMATSTVPFALPAYAAGLAGDIKMIKGPHSADEAKFEAMIIDDFKKIQPGVNVEFTTYDWANMNAQLTTGFASGSPADVLYLVDLVYPNYAQQGALHNMADLVNAPDFAAEKAAIAPFAWKLATTKDGIWGVPVLGAVYNIFINKDLLAKAGVLDTWNKSYADMLDAAKKTTGNGVYGFSMRTRAGDFAFWDWYPYMHNAGADVLNADWNGSGLAPGADAMQFLIDIHAAGVTPPVGSLSTQEQFDLFKAGKIAIHHNETPQIAELMANPPGFEWDVAFAPPGEKGQTAMGNFGILSIAEASPNKEAAWEFIKFWSSGPEVRRFAEQVNLQVVRTDIVDGMFANNPAMQKIQTEFVPRVQGVQPHPQILKVLQSIWPVAEQAYAGGMTGKEAIDKMSEITNQIVGG